MTQLARIARACAGIPDYDAYLAHWRAHHADTPPLDRAAFLREREAARYGRGRSRCC
jgi:uncharacterized short protein YbdD (DUF466 family)